jgi:Kv channel-interacting protein
MIRTKAVAKLIDFLFTSFGDSSFADCELEELEAPQRYRPDSLAQICKTTKFSEPEIKRMYRGFKAHCPNGMVKEDTFKIIYGQFFPQGGS